MIEQHYRDNYKKLVYRIAYRVRGPANAEDVVQEAYARALKYVDNTEVLEFDKWFNRLLNNACKDWQNVERHQGMAWSNIPEDALGGYDLPDSIDLEPLIAHNSPAHQEVLRLYFKSDMREVDIVHVVGKTYGAIHQILVRFRRENQDEEPTTDTTA